MKSRRISSPVLDEVEGVAVLLANALDGIFAGLDVVRDEVIATYQRTRAQDGPFTPRELSALRPVILGQLRRRPFVDGMGILTASDLFSTEPRHLEWWRQESDDVTPLRLDFDPTSMELYDYLTMEWFVHAERERTRCVFGPYVDSRGADHYVVTLATPIVADRFLGVVGADLRMSLFEESFAPVLYELDRELVLVNEERRVVMTNSGRWTVGDRLKKVPTVDDDEFLVVVPVGAASRWVLAAVG